MKKLFHPFRYLAGGKALAWGLIVLILTCVFSWQTGVVARGNMSIGYADGYLSLLAVTVRMLFIWVVPATLLYVASLVFSRSRVRAVDVYGTNLFASIPLTAGMLLAALSPLRALEEGVGAGLYDTARLEALMATPAMIFILVSLLLVIVWYFWWSYSAFSVSANLKGGKAVAIYAVCFILAQILYGPISSGLVGLGLR